MSATVECSGTSVTLNLAPRVAELLAFLASGRGRFFSRADLATSLWGGEEDSVARVNTTLWRLRRTLKQGLASAGDFLVTSSSGAVGLKESSPVAIDTLTFEKLVRPLVEKRADEFDRVDAEVLHRGLELYRGDALVDFSSSWAMRERERLRNLYMDSAARLMQAAIAGQQYEEAARYGALILNLDSIREEIHREMMRVFALGGRRSLALRQFELCRDALHRELGIPPTHETVSLYKSIAAGTQLPTEAVIPVRPARNARTGATLRDTLKVARARLSEADAHLEQVLDSLN
jgi:DNA-binding SARP family transcriptional activator